MLIHRGYCMYVCILWSELLMVWINSTSLRNNNHSRHSWSVRIHIRMWLMYCVCQSPKTPDEDFFTNNLVSNKISKLSPYRTISRFIEVFLRHLICSFPAQTTVLPTTLIVTSERYIWVRFICKIILLDYVYK